MVALAGSHSSIPRPSSNGSDSALKGKILRTPNGFSSSSSRADPCLSCTTFNILAPIYKRLDQQNQSVRESDFRAFWLSRNEKILDMLLFKRSSIICLQEFWVGNEELVEMYQNKLGDAGYLCFKLARTNNRGDGLLTALHKDYFKILNHNELRFSDCGDRVAQLLHVQSAAQQEILIVNTHLLFPHDSSLSIVRLHQAYKIMQHLESYQRENNLNPVPIILCGDWNGSKRGHVYKFLRSMGFASSYDTAHQYTDSDADAHKWVSHRNHRGNICGVDFIWLRNPNSPGKPLKKSWGEAVFGVIKNQLQKASLAKNDAFEFLKADNQGDLITYSAFTEALREVKLTGHRHGLSSEETEDLWAQADTDGNGVVDYEEFKRIWESREAEKNVDMSMSNECAAEEGNGFKVEDAVLFPPEVEKGMWPENYSLSDHAPLTVVFSPVKTSCSHHVS